MRVEIREIVAHVEGAEAPAVEYHGPHHGEVVGREPCAVGFRFGGDDRLRPGSRIGRESRAVRIVEAGDLDRRFDAERAQGFRRIVRIGEGESRRAVARQRIDEHGEIAHHQPAESHPLVGQERGAGREERDECGAQHRHGQLAFDGQVVKGRHGG